MATVGTRNINWREIEEAATEQLVQAVREESPDENIYGAVFHAFYGDGESIRRLMVAVGTEETLAETVDDGDDDASLRWSDPDFEYNVDPTDELDELASRVEKAAAIPSLVSVDVLSAGSRRDSDSKGGARIAVGRDPRARELLA